MITSNLHVRVDWPKVRDRRPREFNWLMVVLVVVLALINVSAAVLMVGSWVSVTRGMLELERSMQGHPIEIVT